MGWALIQPTVGETFRSMYEIGTQRALRGLLIATVAIILIKKARNGWTIFMLTTCHSVASWMRLHSFFERVNVWIEVGWHTLTLNGMLRNGITNYSIIWTILDFKRKIRIWTGIWTSNLQISSLALYHFQCLALLSRERLRPVPSTEPG